MTTTTTYIYRAYDRMANRFLPDIGDSNTYNFASKLKAEVVATGYFPDDWQASVIIQKFEVVTTEQRVPLE